jgi:pimeloyl-ACP methyl ester carboxylesterase
MKKQITTLLVATFLITSLQGCANTPETYADRVAENASLRREDLPTKPFTITTYSRITSLNEPINVYLDGDFLGWAPTTDPGAPAPPEQALGLRLAALDPSPNVLYIAHPCQLTNNDEACDPAVLAQGRYASLVMVDINRAIDHFALPFLHPSLNLVGASGGASLAILLAARRHDVASLRTVAGNIDPLGAARAHAADSNDDLIDPLPIAPRIALLPQQHLVGTQDTATPPFLTNNFIKALGPTSCASIVEFTEATHTTGWEEIWRSRATILPMCGGMR